MAALPPPGSAPPAVWPTASRRAVPVRECPARRLPRLEPTQRISPRPGRNTRVTCSRGACSATTAAQWGPPVLPGWHRPVCHVHGKTAPFTAHQRRRYAFLERPQSRVADMISRPRSGRKASRISLTRASPQIRRQRAFVEFIEDHQADAFQFRVGQGHAGQHAFGDHFQTG